MFPSASYNSCECTFSAGFFFNDTATTEIYTLSLHDALPIWPASERAIGACVPAAVSLLCAALPAIRRRLLARSEEHTSELQSRRDLVCRLLLEKKKKKDYSLFVLHKKKRDRQGY